MYLLYYILDDRKMDVARIISNEINMIAESGDKLGNKTPCTLAFIGLITRLCMRAHMVLPIVVHETIDGVVDDRYIERFCTPKRTSSRRGQTNTSNPSDQYQSFDD